MNDIKLTIDKAFGFVTPEAVANYKKEVEESLEKLHKGTGKGNDFLGWLHLPSSITEEELADIENTAKVLREKCEIVVAVGIGGSYLGTKAVVEALNNSFDWLQAERKNPVILYAGNNIGEDYLYELSEVLKGKQFGIINISKSGTTTEPALAFRILKKQLEETVREKAAQVKKEIIKHAAIVNGVTVYRSVIPMPADVVKDMAFQLRNETENALVIIGSIHEGKPMLTAAASDSMVKEHGMNVGKIIREAAKLIQGGGGGQPHFATAGGKKTDGLGAAVDKFIELAEL